MPIYKPRHLALCPLTWYYVRLVTPVDSEQLLPLQICIVFT